VKGSVSKFEDADRKGKLDDVIYLKDSLMSEIGIHYPALEISKPSTRLMLSFINAAKKVFGKKPINVAEV